MLPDFGKVQIVEKIMKSVTLCFVNYFQNKLHDYISIFIKDTALV